ncbi:bifunctional DNA primase/polymerase [Geodermatophilus sp. DSM 45219]|uniref:bifunctional DNA primase/polymerase n=1 Tax=Geodermatophilus sp. DSM 45219 TaxID=1881103 RepID=UPI0015A04755|nr:bifunctional DNA primase/polymerase [Geodermatophilus sp. DSM 45219]
MAKYQVRPAPALLDLAQQAGVPGGNGYTESDTYDPIAIATYWAGLGYKVMPLKSMEDIRKTEKSFDQAGKLPAFRGKQYEQGTTDPDLIRKWWTDDPFRGVGLPTQANHLLVVDIDNDDSVNGELNFMEMAAEIGLDVSEVPMSKSPSYYGGYHLYWRLPRAFPKMGLPFISKLAKGVDVPWFVVAPGSWKYTTVGLDRQEKPVKDIGVQSWYAGDPAQIPMAPKVLLEKLKRRGAIKGVPAVEFTVMDRVGRHNGSDGKVDINYYQANGIPLKVTDGQNGVLYRIACKLAGHTVEMPEPHAVDLCWDIIRNSPHNPAKGKWTYEQVEELVHGAYVWVAEDNKKTDRVRAEFIANVSALKGLVK